MRKVEDLKRGDCFIWISSLGAKEIHLFHSILSLGIKTLTDYDVKDGSSVIVNFTGYAGLFEETEVGLMKSLKKQNEAIEEIGKYFDLKLDESVEDMTAFVWNVDENSVSWEEGEEKTGYQEGILYSVKGDDYTLVKINSCIGGQSDYCSIFDNSKFDKDLDV